MSPPNFPGLDYFNMFKKCRGLGAAAEPACSWEGRRILHARCKGFILRFFLPGLRASFLESPAESSIPIAM
jgi:hypothetical protein